MSEKIKVGVINDKRKLLGFFAAKAHRNLVLRVADLIELPLPSQAELVTLLRVYGGLAPFDAGREPRHFFLHHAFDGYLVVPFERLLQADIPVLAELQQILIEYREVRQSKGEPSKTEVCECEGHPLFGGCPKCHGSGQITVYVEMSDEEKKLAELQPNATGRL